MTASFATTTQLAAFLNRTFTAGETAQAQMFLDGATALIQSEANQTLAQAETTAVLAGTWDSSLLLPERPVTAVGAVSLNGVPLASGGDFEWNSRQLLRRGTLFGVNLGAPDLWRYRPGAAFGTASHWGGPESTVTVTYTHGYATIPEDIVTVCLQIAARAILNPAGVQSESLGAYAVRYGTADGGPTMTLSDAERKVIRQYRQP